MSGAKGVGRRALGEWGGAKGVGQRALSDEVGRRGWGVGRRAWGDRVRRAEIKPKIVIKLTIFDET